MQGTSFGGSIACCRHTTAARVADVPGFLRLPSYVSGGFDDRKSLGDPCVKIRSRRRCQSSSGAAHRIGLPCSSRLVPAPMAETLRLFVSATNDLDAERGVIATTLASLPAHNKVEIRRTPAGGDIYDNIFENIANCDRVFFLMGQDITAPAGQEWYLALDLEREIVPLRKEIALTPAGRSFVHGSLVHWDTFRTAGELERLVGRVLVQTLLHPRNRYGLTWAERDLLRQHRFNASEKAMAPDPAGAEGGGILLDERDPDTRVGVLLGEDEEDY